MKPYEIVRSLQNTNSRNEKEAIIMRAAEAISEPDHDQFFAGCKLALDPHVTFYIQQVAKGAEGPGLDFSSFLTVADALSSRSVTGNDARDLVEYIRLKATSEEWDLWYRRILTKDLKCGTTEKTINKILKSQKRNDYIIRTFECQLANDSANHDKYMVGKKIVESKLDGVRALAIITPNGCTLYSRNGKVLPNFPHVNAAIEKLPKIKEWMKTKCWNGFVLDGEIMSASFQDLMKQLYRKDHVDASDSVFYMFDIVPLSDFLSGRYDEPLVDRIAVLKDALSDADDCLRSLDQEEVDLSTEEGQNRLCEIKRAAADAGYEGIMLKDPKSAYECKRTSSWLKMKPYIDVSLTIDSYEEGTNKYEGSLGAFYCSGVEDGKKISVSVGGGYTDEQRQTFWNGRDDLLGHVIEVRADAITQNQDGSYSLRFPRFLRFRGTVAGEKM